MYRVDEVIPQRAPMVVIDELLACGEDEVTAQVVIRKGSPFADLDGRVSTWIGIEYMAQSIAAWAGIQALKRGDGIVPGYLLGTRKYHVSRASFELDSVLTVNVKRSYWDGDVGAFECQISVHDAQSTMASRLHDGDVACWATLNVYQPRRDGSQ